LAACVPALDWREVRPAGTALVVTLPCRPKVSERSLALAGQAVRLAMLACTADDMTWALSTADVGDPERVAPALRALRESLVGNLRAQIVDAAPARVRGATPNEAHARVRLRGHKPDGAATGGEFIVFSHGTQIFQATVLGAKVPAGAAETFFESLRVGA
jgi:hypothetical protein